MTDTTAAIDPTALAEEQDDPIVRFRWKGQKLAIAIYEVPNRLVAECRATTGVTPVVIFKAAVFQQFDIDLAVPLLWLRYRMDGRPAVVQIGRHSISLWDEVNAELTYRTFKELELGWGDDEDDTVLTGADVPIPGVVEVPVDPETGAGS